MIDAQLLTVAILIGAGMAAAISRKNIIKVIMAIGVMGSGVNLFLVSAGYREGGIAPIFTNAVTSRMVLATPQALTLTSIVISLAVTAMMLSLAMMMYREYGSLDTRKRRLSA